MRSADRELGLCGKGVIAEGVNGIPSVYIRAQREYLCDCHFSSVVLLDIETCVTVFGSTVIFIFPRRIDKKQKTKRRTHMTGTFWAFVPAIVAIVLALATKQVYISLFLGILVGAFMYVGGDPLKAMFTLYQVMSEKVRGNTPIIVFLVVLGILVVLMQKSGGAKAYGDWAGKKIKSKGGALAATAGLGCLIFVDDYFNCLTVGSVMRPVTYVDCVRGLFMEDS